MDDLDFYVEEQTMHEINSEDVQIGTITFNDAIATWVPIAGYEDFNGNLSFTFYVNDNDGACIDGADDEACRSNISSVEFEIIS